MGVVEGEGDRSLVEIMCRSSRCAWGWGMGSSRNAWSWCASLGIRRWGREYRARWRLEGKSGMGQGKLGVGEGRQWSGEGARAEEGDGSRGEGVSMQVMWRRRWAAAAVDQGWRWGIKGGGGGGWSRRSGVSGIGARGGSSVGGGRAGGTWSCGGGGGGGGGGDDRSPSLIFREQHLRGSSLLSFFK